MWITRAQFCWWPCWEHVVHTPKLSPTRSLVKMVLRRTRTLQHSWPAFPLADHDPGQSREQGGLCRRSSMCRVKSSEGCGQKPREVIPGRGFHIADSQSLTQRVWFSKAPNSPHDSDIWPPKRNLYMFFGPYITLTSLLQDRWVPWGQGTHLSSSSLYPQHYNMANAPFFKNSI